MNEKDISKLLALSMSLGIANSTYGDYYIFSNELLMNYSVSLIIEIDELLDKGYTKEEIIKIIMECNFVAKDPKLTNEDGEYLRDYSIKMLDIRYNLYIEEKESTKNLKK